MSAKHTPEPWEANDYYGNPLLITAKPDEIGHDVVAMIQADEPTNTTNVYPPDTSAANAARIVACVNGCKGIRDPEKAVPKLVSALREVREWCDLIEQNYPEMRFAKSVRKAISEITEEA